MWENGCNICKCCKEHSVPFCGLCGEFPCEWLCNTLTWDKNGIEQLKMLAEEYRRRSAVFSSFLHELWKKIGTHGIMTLSTCAENRVTSRPMSVVVIDGRFYCQTDENYLKCKQISANSNVALCFKNFSVEGICRFIGKPLDDENQFFARAYQKHFQGSFEAYYALAAECLLEITPTLIYSWEYELTKPYMEYWDFENMLHRKEWK
ncbi:MAG: pyridoxamine 5'-phosphate oxidase family protein [Oscillospiraceae bacterium]|nr:pyridoxamine 5'-phosphate oxidase family protein [Oscillospiraceae bacterium]